MESGVEGFDAESEGMIREPIKYFDIYRERPVRLTVRALIPVREHPKVKTQQNYQQNYILSPYSKFNLANVLNVQ